MTITNALASLAVGDLDAATRWYEALMIKDPDGNSLAFAMPKDAALAR
jgi:hypothetical protein